MPLPRCGRLFRYAWLDFGDGEVSLVDGAVVRAGYGALYTCPPDVKYVEQIREAARFAREHGYGLWSGCGADSKGDTGELTGTHLIAPSEAEIPIPEATAPEPAPEQVIVSDPVEAFGSDASYPDVRIPPAPGPGSRTEVHATDRAG